MTRDFRALEPQLLFVCNIVYFPSPVYTPHTSQTQLKNISVKMDVDDNEDDFYAPEPTAAPAESEAPQDAPVAATEAAPAEPKQEADEDLEEGEEEDEGAMDEDDSSDSDGVGLHPIVTM